MTVVEQFADLFSGLPRAHGIFVPNPEQQDGKLEGSYKITKTTIDEIEWQRHLEGEIGLSVHPLRDDGTVSFAAIDIDEYPVDHSGIITRIDELGLPLVTCRSKSKGAHLYLFLSDPAPARTIRIILQSWAKTLGLNSYEIFPKQDTITKEGVGNGINVPYFGGGDRGAPHVDGGTLSLEEFIYFSEGLRTTLAGLATVGSSDSGVLPDGPPCLKTLLGAGPVKHHRDNTLFNIGVYLKNRYPDDTDWKRELDNYNQRYLSPPLASQDVVSKHRGLNKARYNYMCAKEPIVDLCNKSVCVACRFGVGSNTKATKEELHVQLGDLVKFGIDPPTWILQVNGMALSLTTEQLMDFSKFRKVLLERLNIIHPRITAIAWDKAIIDKLNEVSIVEAPHDAGKEGQIRILFEKYCLQMPAKVRDEIREGKAWWNEEDQQIYFRMPQLLEFISHHRVKITPRELAAYLRNWSATHGQLNIKRTNVQHWLIPFFERPRDEDVEETDVRTSF